MPASQRRFPLRVATGPGASRPVIGSGTSPGDEYFPDNVPGSMYVITPDGAGGVEWSLVPLPDTDRLIDLLGGINFQRRSTAVDLVMDTGGVIDFFVAVIDTTAPRTITLPAATDGRAVVIKDQSGGAAGNAITVLPPAGTIDGAASLPINTNYGVLRCYSDGANWFTW